MPVAAIAATFPFLRRRAGAPDRRRARSEERPAVSNFWDIVWLILSTFVFVAYLLVLFQIVVDLFRDHELGGGFKALWIIGLIFLPVMTALVYIVARGRGMAERQRAAVQRAKTETDAYIRDVAGKSPADQIATAKTLLDAGTITQDEFARLKAKALA
jgi:heme/copper-type cytochrome/quinol oxidase subunit 2